MGDNSEFAGKNPFTDSPKNNTPQSIKTIFELPSTQVEYLGRESLSFLCDDLGRESLGIIHLNNLDIGRESLSIFNLNNLDAGRESLGIINLNNLDVGRESLGITNIRTYDFTLSKPNLITLDGKENTKNIDSTTSNLVSNSQLFSNSLEKLRINNEPLSSSSIPTFDLPEVLITSNSNSSVSSILNRGFLQPTLSCSSSISSIYPSFNSGSLETTYPSGIYAVSSSSYRDTLNDAFEDTSQFMKHILKSRSSASSVYPSLDEKISPLNNLNRRINSLPSTLGMPAKDRLNSESNIDICKGITEELKNDIEDICYEDGFNDSVFIEGKHIAYRIADGSILDEGNQDDMLDSTQEPEDFVNLEKEEEEPLKCDTETVFKIVDKMFTSREGQLSVPTDENHLNVSLKATEKCNNSSRSIKSNSSDSKSKEAMEIINTLSDILNNDNPSDKQKSQGQNLLSSLAEILLSSTSSNRTKSPSYILDDSGHSSIEIEPVQMLDPPETYEVLDLRKKSCSETNVDNVEPEVCLPLDLSLKSKTSAEKVFVSPKSLPPKFHRNPQHMSLTNISNQSVGTNSSLSSNESRSLNDLYKKFKPKKSDNTLSSLKKGPMKAVIPLDSMARRNSLKVTPKRSELNAPKHKMKKTSTPINESTLKPMAQSTPDNPKTVCPISPLARPSSSDQSGTKLLKHKLNYSRTNVPSRKSSDGGVKTAPLRRGFSGDLKKTAPEKPFTKSYSFSGKVESSNKVASTTRKIPQRTSLPSTKTAVLKENKNKPVLVRQSTGKKFGKENL